MESNDDYPKIIPRINRSQSLLDHSSTPNLENNGIPIEPLVRRNHTLSNSGGRNRTERKVTLENSLVSEEQSFTPQQHSVVEKTISSFVVMRGAKGADELSPRISNPYFISSGPPLSVSPPRLKAFIINPEESSAVRPVLESRNSLAFLESGAENTEEDWERRILETRQVENNKGDQFPARRPSPTTATSFQGRSHTYSSNSGSTLGHSRSQTERHTESPNSWNDSPETLRRRQSLNFRIQENSTQSITTADRFESEKLLASGLSFNNVNSSFSRTRSGTGPPGLTLSLSHNNHNRTNQTLLSHSNSLNSHSSSLSHSNSLSTPSLSTPHSLGGGALSPVGVFPRSPWSPTVEEANQLGMGSGVPASSLTRGESGSSRGSGSSSRIAVRVVERKDSDEIDSPVSAEGDGTDAGIATAGNFGSIQFNRDEPRRSLTLGKAPPSSRRLPPLMTNSEILSSLATPSTTSTSMAATQEELVSSFLARQGPASAAAYVPPIGHSHFTGGNIASSDQYSQVTGNGTLHSIAEPNRNFTAAPGVGATDWIRQKESIIGYTPSTTSYQSTSSSLPSSNGFPSLPGQNSNPTAATNAGESWPAGGGFGVGLVIRQQEQIQILQNQMHLAMQQLALNSSLNSPIPGPAAGSNVGMNGIGNGLEREVSELETEQGILPIDIQALIATKGYNPTNFNVMPQGARFFVIKSYTEEDVHKSLKHEIWASTDLGNKRLDRAFRESSEKGPIYLFFSVNASGHFAGMAQMLSSVDYATSSNVWASDKWKGILKVRWIYIKDVPLASLRHIRLSNTPENKPVTSSRDTQEVPYEAGCEVLRILSSFQSRTSLLQDFAYYEAGATSPSQTSHYQQTTSRHSIPPQQHSQQQQHHQQANYPSHPNYPQQQQQHYYGFQATAQVPVGVDGNRRYFNNGNNEQYYHQQAF